MGCQNSNATAPSPGIAPAIPGSSDTRTGTPDGRAIDPRRVAEDLVTRHGEGGMDPRVRAVCPAFDAPFFQAGLAGYSDAAMRIIARRHGCPYCVTEALLDQTLLGGGRGFTKADLGDLADNVPGGDDDHPLAGQIMGSEPAEMAASAVKMLEQGTRKPKAYRRLVDGGLDDSETALAARTFSTIDVNLACPVKKVSKKARGGHWLSEPAGAIRILEAVREAVPAEIPVTVKLRRSFDDSEEMRENFERLFDAAYDIGCAWVCVHGRTVQQKYVGPSRWDMLREIAQRKHPGAHRERIIFGSGDIWEAADVFRMIAYTGMTGVSVARGCIGNPWIFRQCRSLLSGREPLSPTVAEQRSVLEQHFDLALAVNERMVRGIGESRTKRAEHVTGKTMRKFGIRFAAHHPQRDAVKKRFVAVETLDDWRGVLNEYYTHTDS